MNDLDDFVERYVAVWNEPDSASRRERIAALWTPGGASLHRVLEPRGHAALESRGPRRTTNGCTAAGTASARRTTRRATTTQ